MSTLCTLFSFWFFYYLILEEILFYDFIILLFYQKRGLCTHQFFILFYFIFLTLNPLLSQILVQLILFSPGYSTYSSYSTTYSTYSLHVQLSKAPVSTVKS